MDRRYDLLICLLEVAVENDLFPADLAKAAVLGIRQVAGAARAGQGFPVNWASPGETCEIEKHLKQIDQRNLFDRFTTMPNPPQRQMYKGQALDASHSGEKRKQFANSLLADLRELTRFYTSARQTGFGVIVLRD